MTPSKSDALQILKTNIEELMIEKLTPEKSQVIKITRTVQTK